MQVAAYRIPVSCKRISISRVLHRRDGAPSERSHEVEDQRDSTKVVPQGRARILRNSIVIGRSLRGGEVVARAALRLQQTRAGMTTLRRDGVPINPRTIRGTEQKEGANGLQERSRDPSGQ